MTDTAQQPRTSDTAAPDSKPGPGTRRALEELRRAISADSALDSKTKQVIAVGAPDLRGRQH